MSELTPVTNSAIVIDNGSTRKRHRGQTADLNPVEEFVPPKSTVVSQQPSQVTRVDKNARKTRSKADPARLGIAQLLAKQRQNRKAQEREGRYQIDRVNKRNQAPGPALSLKNVQVVGGDAGAMTENTDDDAEANDNFGSGDTRTKNTSDWPAMSSSLRANVTNVRLTEFSISSTHINITNTLRRTIRPMPPMVKRRRQAKDMALHSKSLRHSTLLFLISLPSSS